MECVSNHVLLDFVVKTRISAKRGTRIHFKQVRLVMLVNQNVESKNLEAHTVIEALRLARPVQMIHLWLASNDGLDNHIFDFIHEFFSVTAFFRQNL